jgi:hypothetical protein
VRSYLQRPIVRRGLVVTGILALLVVIYAVLGFWGLPHFLRSGLENFVQTHYARRLTLGEIRFNPFTLTLEVRDFSLPDADGVPLLGAGRLLVSLEYASLWRRGLSFQDIVLERPFGRVLIRPNGALNLADLAKPFAGGAPAPPATKSAPLRLFIDRLAVLEGRVTFEDRTRAVPFKEELLPLTFELRDFSTVGKADDEYQLTAATPAGERFRWSGTLAIEPVVSRGRFEVTALQARTLWSYLSGSVPFELSSGVIGITGDYDLSAAKAPVALKLTVRDLGVSDLGIKPAGGDSDYIRLQRLEAHDTHFDLAQRSLVVGPVHLVGGSIRASLDADGSINLLNLAPRPSPGAGSGPPPAPPGEEPQPAAWTVEAPEVTVSALKVVAENRQLTPAAILTLDGLDIHIAGFRDPAGPALDVTLATPINGAGKLSAKGRVDLKSGALQGHIELAQLDLTALQPYLAQRSALSLLSGRLATQLDIERTADNVLTVTGGVDVAQFRTVDNALRKDFIKWDDLALQGIEYRSRPANLKIRDITARAPYARVIVQSNRTLNIAEALSPTQAPATPSRSQKKAGPVPARTAASADASPAMSMAVGTIRISNGSAHYSDLWIVPNFAVAIQGLNGTVSGLSSLPQSRARVSLDGKVDRYAPVTIRGDVNLLSASVYTDLKMKFDGVDMSTITPYSGHFAGYKIEKGKLSVDLAYHIEQRKLQAEQHFVIDQLQLGEKVDSPDAVKLPLKLAVALLKDRNGVIDLPLPISGSLDDPEFRIGPIIWKAVINLLSRIATAPFALLGRLFGGSEQMNLIDFDPGSAVLSPQAHERLAGIIKSMQGRPQLELDVPSTYAPDVDRPSLASEQLHAQLLALRTAELARKKGAATADDSALTDPREHFRLLVAAYRAQRGAQAALPPQSQALEGAKSKNLSPDALTGAIGELEGELTAQAAVDDDALKALARKRGRVVQDALLGDGSVEAKRVFMLTEAPQSAVDGKVRVELALK